MNLLKHSQNNMIIIIKNKMLVLNQKSEIHDAGHVPIPFSLTQVKVLYIISVIFNKALF